MKRHDACFSMNISEGFATVEIVNGKFEVKFLNDEGWTLLEDYGDSVSFESVNKVAQFINELKSIKLKDSEI